MNTVLTSSTVTFNSWIFFSSATLARAPGSSFNLFCNMISSITCQQYQEITEARRENMESLTFFWEKLTWFTSSSVFFSWNLSVSSIALNFLPWHKEEIIKAKTSQVKDITQAHVFEPDKHWDSFTPKAKIVFRMSKISVLF